jgi:hypothetical protein
MQLPIQIPTFEEIPIGQMVANVHDYKSYDRWIQNENEKQNENEEKRKASLLRCFSFCGDPVWIRTIAFKFI